MDEWLEEGRNEGTKEGKEEGRKKIQQYSAGFLCVWLFNSKKTFLTHGISICLKRANRFICKIVVV